MSVPSPAFSTAPFIKSIRGRIVLWLAFLLVAILSGFGVTAYQLYRVNQLAQVDETLKRHVGAIAADLRPKMPGGPGGPGGERGQGRPPREELEFEELDRRPPPERKPPGEGGLRGFHEPGPNGGKPRGGMRRFVLSDATLAVFAETNATSPYFVIWSRGGKLIRQSTNAPTELSRPAGSEKDARLDVRTVGLRREVFNYNSIGECILVGRSMESDLQTAHQFAWWLVAAGGAILLLGLGGGWWLATGALRPIEHMAATAGRIAEGNLAERIDVTETENELGRLATVLNTTFAKLDAAFAQQKQFTADASHELRTPLAVLISEAQTTLARDRSTEEYRETVEACLAAAQQMRRLTDRLLQLARLDAGEGKLEGASLDLADCAAASVELVQPLAVQRGIRLGANLKPAKLSGDSELLGQVITNLLTNAIHYNRDNGEVRIATNMENGEAVVRVSDTGQGIGDADLPHIFKRFFRADQSRARANGRNGLGLAICKAIVDAHGGRIDVETELGKGATFTVRLPA
ncbi:MAG: HAMP domain-containing protein [Verrucomicrobia bacterium]|nr:HAMP domain-containing protein [Verrucomicrobiota bacterium]